MLTVIGGILIAGLLLTAAVSRWIAASPGGSAGSEVIIPGEVIGMDSPEREAGPGAGVFTAENEELIVIRQNEYSYDALHRRLEELDEALERDRRESGDNSAAAQRAQEETRLKAWTHQMEMICEILIPLLDAEEASSLSRRQQELMISIAGDPEAVRARAYELLETYRNVLP